MKPVKLFITDLDGTLLKSDSTFSNSDLKSLEYLGSRGILRVIATGRSLFSFERTIHIKLPIDYIIFSNGAGISSYPDPMQNILLKQNLTEKEITKIITVFEEEKLEYMIHDKIPENHKFYYKSNVNSGSDFKRRIQLYKNYCKPFLNNKLNYDTSAQLLAIISSHQKADIIIKNVRDKLPDLNTIKTTSPLDKKSIWIEVFPNTVSKSITSSWLADKYSISSENVLAVGNDYNDMDLLGWAGTGIVVNNAPKDLKEKFFSVSSNNDSGISDAIEKWIKE